ncbi:MAG TPA: alcohol dehydrogenase catalytic domain-containing protein [Thermoanaerobaculia bacterium]
MPLPKPGQAEVLIKVLATAVCGSDKHIYQWDPSMAGMVRVPRIYGHEFCGEIAAFGTGGKRPHLAIGQYVSAEMHVTCGHCRPCRTGQRHICENTKILGVHGDGCFAQYVVVPAFNVVPLDRAIVPVKVGAFLDALGNAVHTTQVADLSGKSVAVLGYGPIGAMCAEIARVSGASHIAITEVNSQAAAHARRWAQSRGARNVTVIDLSRTKDAAGSLRDALGGGADVVLELSGAEPSINLGLEAARRGATVSLLGLPKGKSVTIRDYTNDFIFKGLTLHGIVGRRVFDTWIKMLDLLAAGLEVSDLVTDEFEGLEKFHEAMERLENRKAMKVVFYPNGKPRTAD